MQRTLVTPRHGSDETGSSTSVPPVFRASRYSHRELWIAWTALAILVALQLALTRYWLDLIDEGYFAELADRVARGELPYRDFATPYTPALHYLHAWAFGLFGRDLVTMRLILTVLKAGFAVLLYVLGRRLMPPLFAALPVALVFSLDTVPLMWEPHPAWYSLTFALVGVWALTRLVEGGSDRWVAVAGLACGLSCAFKQNMGLFTMLAAGAFLLFRSSDLGRGEARLPLPAWLAGRRTWLGLRTAAAVGLLAALTWLLRAYLEPKVALVFLAPLAVLAGGALVDASQRREQRAQLECLVGRLGWLTAGWLAVTLAWVTPLLIALGPSGLPLGQFVGALDLSAFYWELVGPRLGFAFYVLLAFGGPISLQRWARRAPLPLRLIEAGLCLGLVAFASDAALADAALANPDLFPDDATPWNLSVRAAESVLIYLPTLATWGGFAALGLAGRSLTRTAQLGLRWYLVAGSLLLFNLYPRMDTMHITFSGPLLFVVGAFAAYCLFRSLERRLPDSPVRPLYRLAIFGSLLVLPAVAALPGLEWRAMHFFTKERSLPHFDPPDYVPFGVAGASVLVPTNSRDAIGGVAHYLQARTAPGEPIFAYPTVPMFYFLADRPNATRFGHVFPGAATPDELHDMIASLEAKAVRYVVWDQYWVDEWGGDGKHLLNRELTDYLLSHYHTETMVGPFHILARNE